MKINLKYGIGKLRFGMRSDEVKKILGEPSEKRTKDDESHKYYLLYNKENITLTFYINEGDKLGYIETTNPKVNFKGKTIIGQSTNFIKDEVFQNIINKWELAIYHSFSTLFNEESWLTLSIEYEKITGIELGVSFKNDENYRWPDEIDEDLIKKVPNSINQCKECESQYFKIKSEMKSLCPECSHIIYGYENCEHKIINDRCKYCYWDGSKSDYIKKKAST